MRSIFLILIIIIAGLFTVYPVIADDCETLNEYKVCLESSLSTTLSWTSPIAESEGYKIEARDFNWLGSVSIKVSKNGIEKNGLLSEGESYFFGFSNSSAFEGIKIIADQVSNINSFPPNIGTYPGDPIAKISVKKYVPEKKKKPAPGISISAEKDSSGSTVTANVNLENSGESDLLDTDLMIFYDGLKIINEFDLKNGLFDEVTVKNLDIKWENVSTYKLKPANPGIIKNGFSIKILNFSNRSAIISASYNQSIKSNELVESESIVFDFTTENEYRGIKIFGKNIANDSVELILQSPEKNSVKRSFLTIPAGGKEQVKLKFQIPGSLRKTYVISAASRGKDKDGNVYEQNTTAAISLQDTFKFQKITSNSILGENLYDDKSRVGNIGSIKNITYVMISVDNIKNYPVYGIQLTDTILPSFYFKEDMNRTSMSWNFDMKPGEHKEFTYAIMAKRQGIYNFPDAELVWNEWGEENHMMSNAPKTTVSGPYIVMERSFNKSNIKMGDTVEVILTITNNGDLPANIRVIDTVPQNATFLSGVLSFSGFLRPAENAKIAYLICANDDVIEFKAPEMKYKDQGFEWYEPLPSRKLSGYAPVTGTAQAIVPHANMPEKTISKGIFQMVNEKFPWLEGTISILAVLFGIFLLILLNKTSYFKTYEK